MMSGKVVRPIRFDEKRLANRRERNRQYRARKRDEMFCKSHPVVVDFTGWIATVWSFCIPTANDNRGEK